MPARRRTRDEPDAGILDAAEPVEEYEENPIDEDEGYRDEDYDVPRRLNAMTAGEAGLRHIAELTSRQTEGVTLVKPQDDGWLVGVEVVEDRRIPSSGDILALYEAELDEEGNLLSYRRLRRYRRGSGDLGEAAR
ncbi:gas vesicle protein GvpO [Nonomuraea indica]|uniref:Gas vesicle protein GvpO n=1 Tax=Nonomuraea indica TaxID=1581193 RepID=A0ABW8A1Y7_9ACTN